ncbi:hypothetical protein [Gluconobacter sp.]|uniref:hypothetical protein n=1 Tax=Gluconobacter sp. TaxID=1876758 RepID=UPI0039E7CC75
MRSPPRLYEDFCILHDGERFQQDLLIHAILPFIISHKGRSAPQKTGWKRYRDCDRIYTHQADAPHRYLL